MRAVVHGHRKPPSPPPRMEAAGKVAKYRRKSWAVSAFPGGTSSKPAFLEVKWDEDKATVMGGNSVET